MLRISNSYLNNNIAFGCKNINRKIALKMEKVYEQKGQLSPFMHKLLSIQSKFELLKMTFIAKKSKSLNQCPSISESLINIIDTHVSMPHTIPEGESIPQKNFLQNWSKKFLKMYKNNK